MLSITKIVVGALDTNCYVVRTKTLDALIIDPGADAGAILKIVKHCRLTVRGYLITHGHVDHISALEQLWQQEKAPVAMHGLDAAWAFGQNNQLPPYFTVARRPEKIDCLLKGGEIFKGRVGQSPEPNGGTMPPAWPAGCSPRLERGPAQPDMQLQCRSMGDFHFRVISAPGHSPGSVCFYFPEEKILFSGDTLFQDSIGRTDLPGGNQESLDKSLKILASLPPETKVYPGHGPETTIQQEINSNPFITVRQRLP